MDADPNTLFERLAGHAINRWQQRLLCDLVNGDVPDALDIPTGLGKTSIITLWLVARAMGAPVPRRLVYIVDRRAVVDQASTLAAKLSDALYEDQVPGLRSALGFAGNDRLPVSTLRGQFADNREWLRDPSRPAIIVGTVDMTGSRLLFSGYGVPRGQRSMHAALLGCDSLVVLDESHLAPAFDHLLGQLTDLAARRSAHAVVPAMSVLRLSATGATGKSVFQIAEEDERDKWIKDRLHASKWVRSQQVSEKALISAMVARAVELAGESDPVVVFVHQFSVVNKIVDELRKWWRSDPVRKRMPAPVVRLTGQTRIAERAQLVQDPVFQRFTGTGDADGPAFLVANSAGEVGVDFSAAHMVCDLVAWERMVQRLGRVNRTGLLNGTLVDVFHADVQEDSLPARTLDVLSHEAWSRDPEGRLNASPAALRHVPKDCAGLAERVAAATTPEPWRPAFRAATMDAWSMTSSSVHAGRPSVAPWLRGWPTDRDPPDATIVWRGELPSSEQVSSYLRAAPPHLLEGLSTSVFILGEWLAARVKATEKLSSRQGAAVGITGQDNEQRAWARALGGPAPSACVAIQIDADGTGTEVSWFELARNAQSPAAQRRFPAAGSTLIIDHRFGGLDPHGVLDDKSADPVPAWDVALATPDSPGAGGHATVDPRFEPIPRRFFSGLLGDAQPGYVRLDYLDSTEQQREAVPPEGRWVERLLAASADERSQAPESLMSHQSKVAAEVHRMAQALGLSDELSESLFLSAAHHDEGKAAEHWQSSMGVPVQARPLAKTGRTHRVRSLKGYRHEFGSYLAIQRIDAFVGLEPRDQDLVLHLIASHHGRARPHLNAFDPDRPPSIDRLASPDGAQHAYHIAERFLRLQDRYGHHQLAFLECLLRSADWNASAGVGPGIHS